LGFEVYVIIRKLLICVVLLSACSSSNRPSLIPSTGAEVAGLSEAELRAKYTDVKEIDNSFSILVSKNLHPYHPPEGTKFLRFGKEYLVAELRNGRVVALHRVSG
jgi:hypothetical protein